MAGHLRWLALGCLLSPALTQTFVPLVRPYHVGNPAAFDTVRRRLVMLDVDGSTWELAGGELLPRATPTGAPTPTARTGHSMCYDEARRRVLMFGGIDASGDRNDTWVYDGAGWTQLTGGPAPAPRRLAAMAWDSARNRAVLWGSRFGFHQDTWEHDGTAWLQRTPATWPTGTYTPGPMVFDPQRGVTVLVIPQVLSGSVPSNTWEWDGLTWTHRGFGGPSTSPAASMAFDAARNRMVLVGGAPNDRVWEWDGNSWTGVPLPQPFRRLDAATWFDPGCGCVTIAGGTEYTTASSPWTNPQPGLERTDRWQWNGQTLTLVQADTAGPQANRGVLIPDPLRGRVLHFGGSLPLLQFSNATWALAGGVWSTVPSPTSPSPRARSAAAHDLTRGEGLLFGGENNSGLLGDTWSIAGAGWVARSTTGPSPRKHASMAADLARDVVVLFGGQDDTGRRNDTWEWNGTTWMQRVTTVEPSARNDAAMAYHPLLGKVLLFSGDSPGGTNDTWTWDGVQWTQLSPATVPPLLSSPSMSTNLTTSRTTLVGVGSNGQGQIWEHDGIDWRPVPLTPPQPWFPCVAGLTFDTLVCGVPPDTPSGAANAVVELTTQPGRVSNLGTGCGTPASKLLVRSRPRIGATTGLELVANPNRAALFALDLASGSTPLGGGCTFWLGANFVSLLQISSTLGLAEQPLPVPMNRALRGLELFAQAAVLEPQSINGLVLTQGLRLVLGD